LDRWNTPDQCDALLSDYRAEFGKVCGADRNLQPWREAFHATSFARAHQAIALRIGSDPPDFLFKFADGESPVEITEVKSTHDIRGDGFLQWAELEEQGLNLPCQSYDPSGDWEAAPEGIRQAICRKAAKNYPPETILAVAVSSFWYGDSDNNTAQQIEAVCLTANTMFSEIWVSIGSQHLRVRRMADVPGSIE